MSHNFKETRLKCFVWSIQECNSTLSTENFKVQGHECKLEFQVESFWALKVACLRFKCKGKLQSPIPVTLRVLSINTIAIEQFTLSGEDEELWKCRGISFLDSSLVFEFTIHTDLTEKHPVALSSSFSPKEANKKPVNSKTNTNHLEALSRDFSKLLDENVNCDVDVTCDGQTFKVHRIVLATRSAVFSAMLKSSMIEGATGQIQVEDCKAPVFQSLLRYLYSGKLPELNLDSATHLYEVSDKYDVKELKGACSDFLIENLTEDNATEILILADQHGDEEFRKNVVSYAVDKSIPQCDRHWSNFCKKHSSLANEVMLLYIQKHCPK